MLLDNFFSPLWSALGENFCSLQGPFFLVQSADSQQRIRIVTPEIQTAGSSSSNPHCIVHCNTKQNHLHIVCSYGFNLHKGRIGRYETASYFHIQRICIVTSEIQTAVSSSSNPHCIVHCSTKQHHLHIVSTMALVFTKVEKVGMKQQVIFKLANLGIHNLSLFEIQTAVFLSFLYQLGFLC